MEKRLKKYTSIPEHLYVNRSADEQLKRIVNEMQRPGYVLVARQMGKTNLLFNAKRTLENKNRLFVYVDLSNVFKYERDCYRNIIDTIIEPNEEIFSDIEAKLEVLRSKALPPHKEYSNSLRIVLDHFLGDIVIVLDEIDALRSAEYSDNIFAQIRSNYFSRTNFPVFERLTYILSGVIEPTELIKDRNKSPFNIGDKIYLDDFSFDEHNVFIKNSKLNISKEISDRIFYWSNGSPRLTFDICSALENLLIEGKNVTIDSLNGLVRVKYLTNFDIAPIDHIRELVKGNKLVRDTVLKIQQQEDNLIVGDEIKKKLYLFGIINSKFNESIQIKNPIIEYSLSKEWIESIDNLEKSNYGLGIEKIDQYKFEEGILLLQDYLDNSSPTSREIEHCNYKIGFAQYRLKKFKVAIKYFAMTYSESLLERNSNSFLGVCKIAVGEVDEGESILSEIIEDKKNDFSVRNAILNIAPIIAKSDGQYALKLYQRLFDSTIEHEDDLPEDDSNKIKTLSMYFMAEVHANSKDTEKAIDCLHKALKYADVLDSLDLKKSIFNLSNFTENHYIIEIVDTIINEQLKFDEFNSYPISFCESHLYDYVFACFVFDDLKRFEDLIEYSSEHLFNNNIGKYEIAYNASKDIKGNEEILKYLLRQEEVSSNLLLLINRDLSFIEGSGVEFFKYFTNYDKLFFSINEGIEAKDIHLYALAIKNHSDKNNFAIGHNLCRRFIDKLNNLKDEGLAFESIIIYYWFSQLNYSLNYPEETIKYADKTIGLISESSKKRTSMIDEEGVRSILDQMNRIKNFILNKKTFIRDKKINRNKKVRVRYRNGTISEGKYKKFEKDLLSENCELI